MLRFRFSSGLLLGLVAGVPAGVLIGIFMLPARSSDPGATTSLQIVELTRKLEAARDDKERSDRQLEQFQKLADQMTATFKSLEQRFNALEEAQRLHETPRPASSPPEVRAPAPEAAPAATPTPPAPAAGADPAEPAGTEPDDSANAG